jgi:hypothetical protein
MEAYREANRHAACSMMLLQRAIQLAKTSTYQARRASALG